MSMGINAIIDSLKNIVLYINTHPWLSIYLSTTGVLAALDIVIAKEINQKIKKNGYKNNNTKKSTLKDRLMSILMMTFPGLNLLFTIYISKVNNDEKELEDHIKTSLKGNFISKEEKDPVKERIDNPVETKMTSIPPRGEVDSITKEKVRARVMEGVSGKK